MTIKSLVDALHVELLRYKYDDRQENCGIYGNHCDIQFERKSHANINDSYASDNSYITKIWDKPTGHITDGSIGAKRIRFPDQTTNLSKEQNSNKYINRWLIKEKDTKNLSGRVDEIFASQILQHH